MRIDFLFDVARYGSGKSIQSVVFLWVWEGVFKPFFGAVFFINAGNAKRQIVYHRWGQNINYLVERRKDDTQYIGSVKSCEISLQ